MANHAKHLVPGVAKGGPAWAAEEDARLLEFYPPAFPEELSRLFPGRTPTAVRQHANVLGSAHGPRRVFFPREFLNPADGGYVSGLTDGEGSFIASVKKRRGRWNINPKFTMNLRVDDSAILLWMIRYFGCGHFHESWKRKSPLAVFTVASCYELLSAVIPHFDAYPLRAKKKQDYAIWLNMVELQAANFRQPWSDTVRDRMLELYEELQAVRRMM